MEQTKKQYILTAFDKAIENSARSNSGMPIAAGFIVCLTGKSAGGIGIAVELVIVDEVNLSRKRDYLAAKLDDDGYYIGTNKTVQVGTVFSNYMPLIGNQLQEALSDFYSQILDKNN